MARKALVLVILLLVCLVSAPCRPAPAETISLNGFQVVLSPPKVEFPNSITFDIEAKSDANISRLTLHYQIEKLSPIPITSVAFPQFEPALLVKTSWKWDMRRTGGLPPGTKLEYWWSIVDAEGDRVETPIASLSFDDDRYSWRSLANHQINLLWYQGDGSFAQELVTAAVEALDRLAEDTSVQLEGEARIYIYANSQDLQGAMVYPQEWTGGVAFTEYSTIAIGISPNNLTWGRSAIAHELAHLVVHQVIFSGYGVELPTWLDEGLAMYAEGELSPGLEYILVQAMAQNWLFSAKSLCSPFPAQTEAASLAYAQSYSLVEYLLEKQGGKAKMCQLLNAFKQGSGYIEALDQVYGLDIDQLDKLWREYVVEWANVSQ